MGRIRWLIRRIGRPARWAAAGAVFFAIRFDPKKRRKMWIPNGRNSFWGYWVFFFTGFLQQSVPADVDTLAIGFSLVLSGFFFNTTDSFTGVFTGFYLV